MDQRPSGYILVVMQIQDFFNKRLYKPDCLYSPAVMSVQV